MSNIKAEAFIDEDETRLEVRLRRMISPDEWMLKILSDASASYEGACIGFECDVTRARLSTDEVHRCTSYHVTVNKGDVGQVKARIIEALQSMGYTLVSEKFPV